MTVFVQVAPKVILSFLPVYCAFYFFQRHIDRRKAVRYLLVGNAPNPNLAPANDADIIVQINTCPHAEALPSGRTSYVFIANTGHATSPCVVEQLCSRRALLLNPTIVLARNPTYYTIKKWILRACGLRQWRDHQISQAWTKLRELWPIQTVDFFSSLRLDLHMMLKGMPFRCQPSTGMVAYNWLHRRLRTGDSLAVEGFAFQGWEGHPWQIESQLIRPKQLPYAGETKGLFSNGLRARKNNDAR